MTTLQWIPDFIGWIFFSTVLVTFFLSWWMYGRNKPEIHGWIKYVLIALRTISLTIVTLLIIHPQILINRVEEKFPDVAVWIDRSGSMEKMLTTENEVKIRSEIKALLGDSINLTTGYFARSVSTEDRSDAQWKSQTNLTPLISESKSEINIIITDGVIDDYEWLLGKPENIWNFVSVGDTTRPTGLQLKSATDKSITAFEGDKVTLFASLSYHLKTKTTVEIEFEIADSTETVSVNLEEESGSQLVSSQFIAPGSGEYQYKIRLKNDPAGKQEIVGKLNVKSRIRQVYIITHSADPLTGFFKRRLTGIGTVKTQIIIDNNLTTPPEIDTGNQSLFILINYPQTETKLFHKIKAAVSRSNMMVVSNEEILPEIRELISPKWTAFPLFISGQRWLPLLGRSSNDISFWTGWSENEFREMPPFTTPIRFIPESVNKQSYINVDQQQTEFASHLVREELVRRSWILKGNYEEWERWDAVNNINPPRISLSSSDFMIWMLTPTGTKTFGMKFQPILSGIGTEAILNLTGEKISDSITVNMTWNSQNYPMQKNENQLYSVRLPESTEEKSPYSYQIYKNGKLSYEDSGFYYKPNDDNEKNVLYAVTEPLKSWVMSNKGWAAYQSIDKKSLTDQINSSRKKEISQTHIDSWSNIFMFIAVVIASGSEWLIRKRLGSL